MNSHAGVRMLSLTTSGLNIQTFPFDYFLPEFVATANRCGMAYSGQVHTCGINSYSALTDQAALAGIQKDCTAQSSALLSLISSL